MGIRHGKELKDEAFNKRYGVHAGFRANYANAEPLKRPRAPKHKP